MSKFNKLGFREGTGAGGKVKKVDWLSLKGLTPGATRLGASICKKSVKSGADCYV